MYILYVHFSVPLRLYMPIKSPYLGMWHNIFEASNRSKFDNPIERLAVEFTQLGFDVAKCLAILEVELLETVE